MNGRWFCGVRFCCSAGEGTVVCGTHTQKSRRKKKERTEKKMKNKREKQEEELNKENTGITIKRMRYGKKIKRCSHNKWFKNNKWVVFVYGETIRYARICCDSCLLVGIRINEILLKVKQIIYIFNILIQLNNINGFFTSLVP